MVHANHALRSETGLGGDLGLLLQSGNEDLCVRFELRGHVRRDDDLIRTTDAGVMMLNGVLRALLADRGSAA